MIIVYGVTHLEMPEGLSLDQVTDAMKALYPELANSDVREIDNGYEFFVKAQNKGSDITVKYGATALNFPGDLSLDQVTDAMKALYPELANSDVREIDNGYEFFVKAQNKGSDITVKYGATALNFPGDLSLDQVTDAMKALYPELANSDVREITGGYEFFVKAQNKGF